MAVISAADARGFRHYLGLRQEVHALTERNRQLAEKNQQMLREVERLRADPAALERTAREELGFVRAGEVVLNLE